MKNVNDENSEESVEEVIKKEMKKETKIIIYIVSIIIALAITSVVLYYSISLIIVGSPVAIFGGLILPNGIVALIGAIVLIYHFSKDIKKNFGQKEQ